MAHIDAGKTTLAESMLHVAKQVDASGNHGNVNVQLDCMEQEIKRGITIRSACSSFNWGSYHVNVVDTPGHTDFSGEVYHAMDVIDGCVIIVDGTKGVQAQTRHINASLPTKMPRIIFINKIDRSGVDVGENMQSIRQSLHVNPVLLNVPNKDAFLPNSNINTLSVMDSSVQTIPEIKGLIEELTEALCDVDDILAEEYLTDGSVTSYRLMESLRSNVKNSKGQLPFPLYTITAVVPVVCGSAVTLFGVDQLLNFICELLPGPSSCRQFQSTFPDNTILYAFKSLCGSDEKINAFCKVIKGTMTQNTRLYNMVVGKAEQVGKIYKIYGNNYLECKQLVEGDIGMIEGMNSVRTGHWLSKNQKEVLPNHLLHSADIDSVGRCVCFAMFTAVNGILSDLCILQLAELNNAKLIEAMAKLKIEDPSIYYKYDPDASDSLIVGGYGEFHLEILAEILKDSYGKNVCIHIHAYTGIPVKISKVRVAIKETPLERVTSSMFIDSSVPEDRSHIGLELVMEPMPLENCRESSSPALLVSDSEHSSTCHVDDSSIEFISGNGSKVDNSEQLLGEAKTNDIIANIKQLLLNAMTAGPVIGGPMIATRIRISKVRLLPHSSIAGAKVIASRVLKTIYKSVPIELQQPEVSLNIVLPAEYLGNVLPDLRNNRKAVILSISGGCSHTNELTTIVASAPMKELLGYTKTLRALTNGMLCGEDDHVLVRKCFFYNDKKWVLTNTA
ncbi:translation elongation factor G-related protein [Babesia gibsoni]|uniref:Translation elongation factor G-related protein n=1 Tax=Babesia gibsoni TaxID=33632 RepID=A0AAD8PCZ2_BABGI|nr:translation elongation factor G-related protein [Babesia gibsoni]